MSTVTERSPIADGLDERVLREGYGPGAWHGPDLKAALADVSTEVAFWRPVAGRHNIAEIALHHAYNLRNVRAKLSGVESEPFVLEGDDWFALSDASPLSWPAIAQLVEGEQASLSTLVSDIRNGCVKSPLPESKRFDLILGITCHAVYHAGQVQLIRKLKAGE